MMQRISDLFTGAGLYGCTLNSSAGQTTYNTNDQVASNGGNNLEYFCQANQNGDTTDVNDNWDRTEVAQGVDDVGSGAGQQQVCAALNTPLNADFARSSKGVATNAGCALTVTCSRGVPILEQWSMNPSDIGGTFDHLPLPVHQRGIGRCGVQRLAAGRQRGLHGRR